MLIFTRTSAQTRETMEDTKKYILVPEEPSWSDPTADNPMELSIPYESVTNRPFPKTFIRHYEISMIPPVSHKLNRLTPIRYHDGRTDATTKSLEIDEMESLGDSFACLASSPADPESFNLGMVHLTNWINKMCRLEDPFLTAFSSWAHILRCIHASHGQRYPLKAIRDLKPDEASDQILSAFSTRLQAMESNSSESTQTNEESEGASYRQLSARLVRKWLEVRQGQLGNKTETKKHESRSSSINANSIERLSTTKQSSKSYELLHTQLSVILQSFSKDSTGSPIAYENFIQKLCSMVARIHSEHQHRGKNCTMIQFNGKTSKSTTCKHNKSVHSESDLTKRRFSISIEVSDALRQVSNHLYAACRGLRCSASPEDESCTFAADSSNNVSSELISENASALGSFECSKINEDLLQTITTDDARTRALESLLILACLDKSILGFIRCAIVLITDASIRVKNEYNRSAQSTKSSRELESGGEGLQRAPATDPRQAVKALNRSIVPFSLLRKSKAVIAAMRIRKKLKSCRGSPKVSPGHLRAMPETCSPNKREDHHLQRSDSFKRSIPERSNARAISNQSSVAQSPSCDILKLGASNNERLETKPTDPIIPESIPARTLMPMKVVSQLRSLCSLKCNEVVHPESIQGACPETKLWSFGQNTYGELAQKRGPSCRSPRIASLPFRKTVKQIAAGNEHSLFLCTDSSVYSMGFNESGQCGRGFESVSLSLGPIESLSSKHITNVYAYNGCEHSLCSNSDGQVFSFGFNYYGQLGHGTIQNASTPTLLKYPFNYGRFIVSSIACSYYHTAIVTKDGSIFTFGRNDFGQLGLGDQTDRSKPVKVSRRRFQEACGISCGQFHTVLCTRDGRVFVCGRNNYGQLGINAVDAYRTRFTEVSFRSRGDRASSGSVKTEERVLGRVFAEKVVCGYYHTLVLASGGSIWAFGSNCYGQLGVSGGNTKAFSPCQTMNLDGSMVTVLDIAAGCYHSIAVDDLSTLHVFGCNNHGQLGTGNDFQQRTPVTVTKFQNYKVLSLAAGFYHTLVLVGDYLSDVVSESEEDELCCSFSIPVKSFGNSTLSNSLCAAVFETKRISLQSLGLRGLDGANHGKVIRNEDEKMNSIETAFVLLLTLNRLASYYRHSLDMHLTVRNIPFPTILRSNGPDNPEDGSSEVEYPDKAELRRPAGNVPFVANRNPETLLLMLELAKLCKSQAAWNKLHIEKDTPALAFVGLPDTGPRNLITDEHLWTFFFLTSLNLICASISNWVWSNDPKERAGGRKGSASRDQPLASFSGDRRDSFLKLKAFLLDNMACDLKLCDEAANVTARNLSGDILMTGFELFYPTSRDWFQTLKAWVNITKDSTRGCHHCIGKISGGLEATSREIECGCRSLDSQWAETVSSSRNDSVALEPCGGDPECVAFRLLGPFLDRVQGDDVINNLVSSCLGQAKQRLPELNERVMNGNSLNDPQVNWECESDLLVALIAFLTDELHSICTLRLDAFFQATFDDDKESRDVNMKKRFDKLILVLLSIQKNLIGKSTASAGRSPAGCHNYHILSAYLGSKRRECQSCQTSDVMPEATLPLKELFSWDAADKHHSPSRRAVGFVLQFCKTVLAKCRLEISELGQRLESKLESPEAKSQEAGNMKLLAEVDVLEVFEETSMTCRLLPLLIPSLSSFVSSAWFSQSIVFDMTEALRDFDDLCRRLPFCCQADKDYGEMSTQFGLSCRNNAQDDCMWPSIDSGTCFESVSQEYISSTFDDSMWLSDRIPCLLKVEKCLATLAGRFAARLLCGGADHEICLHACGDSKEFQSSILRWSQTDLFGSGVDHRIYANSATEESPLVESFHPRSAMGTFSSSTNQRAFLQCLTRCTDKECAPHLLVKHLRMNHMIGHVEYRMVIAQGVNVDGGTDATAMENVELAVFAACIKQCGVVAEAILCSRKLLAAAKCKLKTSQPSQLCTRFTVRLCACWRVAAVIRIKLAKLRSKLKASCDSSSAENSFLLTCSKYRSRAVFVIDAIPYHNAFTQMVPSGRDERRGKLLWRKLRLINRILRLWKLAAIETKSLLESGKWISMENAMLELSKFVESDLAPPEKGKSCYPEHTTAESAERRPDLGLPVLFFQLLANDQKLSAQRIAAKRFEDMLRNTFLASVRVDFLRPLSMSLRSLFLDRANADKPQTDHIYILESSQLSSAAWHQVLAEPISSLFKTLSGHAISLFRNETNLINEELVVLDSLTMPLCFNLLDESFLERLLDGSQKRILYDGLRISALFSKNLSYESDLFKRSYMSFVSRMFFRLCLISSSTKRSKTRSMFLSEVLYSESIRAVEAMNKDMQTNSISSSSGLDNYGWRSSCIQRGIRVLTAPVYFFGEAQQEVFPRVVFPNLNDDFALTFWVMFEEVKRYQILFSAVVDNQFAISIYAGNDGNTGQIIVEQCDGYLRSFVLTSSFCPQNWYKFWFMVKGGMFYVFIQGKIEICDFISKSNAGRTGSLGNVTRRKVVELVLGCKGPDDVLLEKSSSLLGFIAYAECHDSSTLAGSEPGVVFDMGDTFYQQNDVWCYQLLATLQTVSLRLKEIEPWKMSRWLRLLATFFRCGSLRVKQAVIRLWRVLFPCQSDRAISTSVLPELLKDSTWLTRSGWSPTSIIDYFLTTIGETFGKALVNENMSVDRGPFCKKNLSNASLLVANVQDSRLAIELIALLRHLATCSDWQPTIESKITQSILNLACYFQSGNLNCIEHVRSTAERLRILGALEYLTGVPSGQEIGTRVKLPNWHGIGVIIANQRTSGTILVVTKSSGSGNPQGLAHEVWKSFLTGIEVHVIENGKIDLVDEDFFPDHLHSSRLSRSYATTSNTPRMRNPSKSGSFFNADKLLNSSETDHWMRSQSPNMSREGHNCTVTKSDGFDVNFLDAIIFAFRQFIWSSQFVKSSSGVNCLYLAHCRSTIFKVLSTYLSTERHDVTLCFFDSKGCSSVAERLMNEACQTVSHDQFLSLSIAEKRLEKIKDLIRSQSVDHGKVFQDGGAAAVLPTDISETGDPSCDTAYSFSTLHTKCSDDSCVSNPINTESGDINTTGDPHDKEFDKSQTHQRSGDHVYNHSLFICDLEDCALDKYQSIAFWKPKCKCEFPYSGQASETIFDPGLIDVNEELDAAKLRTLFLKASNDVSILYARSAVLSLFRDCPVSQAQSFFAREGALFYQFLKLNLFRSSQITCQTLQSVATTELEAYSSTYKDLRPLDNSLASVMENFFQAGNGVRDLMSVPFSSCCSRILGSAHDIMLKTCEQLLRGEKQSAQVPLSDILINKALDDIDAMACIENLPDESWDASKSDNKVLNGPNLGLSAWILSLCIKEGRYGRLTDTGTFQRLSGYLFLPMSPLRGVVLSLLVHILRAWSHDNTEDRISVIESFALHQLDALIWEHYRRDCRLGAPFLSGIVASAIELMFLLGRFSLSEYISVANSAGIEALALAKRLGVWHLECHGSYEICADCIRSKSSIPNSLADRMRLKNICCPGLIRDIESECFKRISRRLRRFTVTEATSTTITVSWLLEAESLAFLCHGYRLEIEHEADHKKARLRTCVILSQTNRAYTFSGLLPSETYRVQIHVLGKENKPEDNGDSWNAKYIPTIVLKAKTKVTDGLTFDPLNCGPNIEILNRRRSVRSKKDKLWSTVRCCTGIASGTCTWKVKILENINSFMAIGVASSNANLDTFIGGDEHGYGWMNNHALFHQREFVNAFASGFAKGDLIEAVLDMDRGILSFSKNDVHLGVAFTGLRGKLFPAISLFGSEQELLLISEALYDSTSIPKYNEPKISDVDDILISTKVIEEFVHRDVKYTSKTFMEEAYKTYTDWMLYRKLHIRTIFGVKEDVLVEKHPHWKSGSRVSTPLGDAIIAGMDSNSTIWIFQNSSDKAFPVHPSLIRISHRKETILNESLQKFLPGVDLSESKRKNADLIDYDTFINIADPSTWTLFEDESLVFEVGRFCMRRGIDPRNLSPTLFLTEVLPKAQSMSLSKVRNGSRSLKIFDPIAAGARFAVLRTLNNHMFRLFSVFDCSAGPHDSLCIGLETLFQSVGVVSQTIQSGENLTTIAQKIRLLRKLVFLPTKSYFARQMVDTFQNRQLADNEREYSKEIPHITVSRSMATASRLLSDPKHRLECSLFGQAFSKLHFADSSDVYRIFFQSLDEGQSRAFRVTFKGEGADDYGGLYREFFSQAFADLCILKKIPSESDGFGKIETGRCEAQCSIPLLMPISHFKSSQNSTEYIPMPIIVSKSSAEGIVKLAHCSFLGKLIGLAFATNVPVNIKFHQAFWKFIVQEPIDLLDHALDTFKSFPSKGIEASDDYRTDGIALVSADRSMGSIDVDTTRQKLCQSKLSISAVYDGIISVIPKRLLPLFGGDELELLICGSPKVNISLLQACTEYGSDYSPNDDQIKWLWRILERFDDDDRSRFLRFVWARSSLPNSENEFHQKFRVQELGGEAPRERPDDYLPKASTCFFCLSLPHYTNERLMESRLKYAIRECIEIDGDFQLNERENDRWLISSSLSVEHNLDESLDEEAHRF